MKSVPYFIFSSNDHVMHVLAPGSFSRKLSLAVISPSFWSEIKMLPIWRFGSADGFYFIWKRAFWGGGGGGACMRPYVIQLLISFCLFGDIKASVDLVSYVLKKKCDTKDPSLKALMRGSIVKTKHEVMLIESGERMMYNLIFLSCSELP